jgi:DNA-3-methyladenine glycosylase II
MTEAFVKEAERALSKLDPALGKLIRSQTLRDRTSRGNYFASLCRSIIGQQVSVAAATAIYNRFEEQTELKPSRVVSLNEAEAKTIGLSRQKTSYLKDLAGHFVEDPAVYNHLETQSDEQVIAELTAVKGIGVWTAQMFLMFTLDRPDVFAPDDVGLQRAMQRLYDWETLPSKKVLIAHAERWQPYRSVASLHLWQLLDNVPLPADKA